MSDAPVFRPPGTGLDSGSASGYFVVWTPAFASLLSRLDTALSDGTSSDPLLAGRVTTVEEALGVLTPQVTAVNDSVASITSRMSSADTEREALRTRATALETGAQTAATERQALSQSVTTFGNRLSSGEAQLQSLSSRLTAVEERPPGEGTSPADVQRITDLEEGAQTAAAARQANANAIGALQTRATALEEGAQTAANERQALAQRVTTLEQNPGGTSPADRQRITDLEESSQTATNERLANANAIGALQARATALETGAQTAAAERQALAGGLSDVSQLTAGHVDEIAALAQRVLALEQGGGGGGTSEYTAVALFAISESNGKGKGQTNTAVGSGFVGGQYDDVDDLLKPLVDPCGRALRESVTGSMWPTLATQIWDAARLPVFVWPTAVPSSTLLRDDHWASDGATLGPYMQHIADNWSSFRQAVLDEGHIESRVLWVGLVMDGNSAGYLDAGQATEQEIRDAFAALPTWIEDAIGFVPPLGIMVPGSKTTAGSFNDPDGALVRQIHRDVANQNPAYFLASDIAFSMQQEFMAGVEGTEDYMRDDNIHWDTPILVGNGQEAGTEIVVRFLT